MYCKYCGAKIDEDSRFCPVCGSNLETVITRSAPEKVDEVTVNEPVVIYNNVVSNLRECNKWVSFFLCLFFGIFGAHKFYEGRTGMGLLYMFTCGLFGFGYVVDLVRILLSPNPYLI